MPRAILDVTRLLTRASHSAATGVDRVELAYARRALAAPADATGFAAIVGRRAVPLDRDRVAAFIAALDRKWRVGRGGDGATIARLNARLGTHLDHKPSAPSGPDDAVRMATRLRLAAIAALSRTPVARGDVYVHVSHIRLDRPQAFERLRAAGSRVSIAVHDLIPICFPEYARPGEAERHVSRMTTVLTSATDVITISDETARALRAFAAARGLATPPITVAPLGVEPHFLAAAPAAIAASRPYFITIGTIEPRKNHLLLLNLWRRMAERLSDATPALVVVGRRGWENEMVLDMLDRAPAIRTHVVEANGLDDLTLAALTRGARALLFPSFSEGFGLPLVEALAIGAPCVVSDLPAFREVAGDAAQRLDPLDGPGWEAAILDHLDDGSPRRAAALAAAKAFRASGWDAHFEIVSGLTGL